MNEWQKAKSYLQYYVDNKVIERRDIRNQMLDVIEVGDKLEERVGEYTQHNLELMNALSDAQTRIKVWKHSAEEKEQKLEAIRELLRNAPVPPEEIPDLIMKILGPSIESDIKRT